MTRRLVRDDSLPVLSVVNKFPNKPSLPANGFASLLYSFGWQEDNRAG